MTSGDEVRKLASLARITVSDEELPKFEKEFESILAYIGQIEKLSVDTGVSPNPVHKNVFREDETPHEKGKYTKVLAEAFSKRDGDYLKVKKIISHD